MNEQLKDQVEAVSVKPGVYMYRDAKSKVIYVGKAKNLAKRVRSYFQASKNHSAKTKMLVAKIERLETIVTGSELEALILEANLIKKYKPRYNILLRDDKSFPYLKLTLEENFPRLVVSRRPHEDSNRYYGPYVRTRAMRETIRLIHRNLKIRRCNNDIDKKRARACIYHEMHQCGAPCVEGGESVEVYSERVKRTRALLEGRDTELLSDFRRKMEKASEGMKYEEAAEYRDSFQAIKDVQAKQRIVLPEPRNLDVIAMAKNEDGEICAQVFFVRSGKLIDRQSCRLANLDTSEDAEVLESFVSQYYETGVWVPPEVVVAEPLAGAEALELWLKRKKGSKVVLTTPKRGEKLKLVRLVEENARQILTDEEQAGPSEKAPAKDRSGALLELKEVFGLKDIPARIEGFDISHVQGSHTVASMVVTRNGYPVKKEYRHYKIKTVEGVDDFASMKEVVGRRYKRLLDEDKTLPDLILVDGGKGQLSAACEALDELKLSHLPIFGLAKKKEEFFVPGEENSIQLPVRSAGRLMVQRLRDEAHRFAVSYHRLLRSKAIRKSELDGISGIGPAVKKRLFEKFISLTVLRKASVEELIKVEGVGVKLAEKIAETLQGKKA